LDEKILRWYADTQNDLDTNEYQHLEKPVAKKQGEHKIRPLL